MGIKNLRIPYKGSKNRIADKLVDKMLQIKPRAKYFVDFFGGGASMSFKAMERGLNVIYNDKDTRLVELLKLIKNRLIKNERSEYGLFPVGYYDFVNREKFFKNINNGDAFSGFAGACYSFGNNFKNYFCSKERETYKKLLHNVIVFNCEFSLELFNEKYNFSIKLSDKHSFNSRRLEIVRQLQQLERLQKLENLERLQKLENLTNLENLKNLECLEILNLSYEEVLNDYDFKDSEVILYCDPPYKNVSGYASVFDYCDFINYLVRSKYTYFISEYYIKDFYEILSLDKIQLFSRYNVSKIKQEKLYINGL